MPGADSDGDRWVRVFQPCSQPEIRLFCFPHAGGSASYYLPFARALAPDIEVLALQYPGRQDRRNEPCIDNVHDLAKVIAGVLGNVAGPPFAFFGHSMGAILAFEVAQIFRNQSGLSPEFFFVSGRRAPSTERPARSYDDKAVLAELRKLGGTHPQFLADPEMLAAIIPPTLNDYNAIESYRWAPEPPLACPIVTLIGDEDPQSTVAEAAAWEKHSTGPFQMRVFTGGHFYLDPCRTEVLDIITTTLRQRSGSKIYDGSTK